MDLYGCNCGTLGDGPSVSEEHRIYYESMGLPMPPQYVDPYGNPIEAPWRPDSELFDTASGEEYRQFFREWAAPASIDTELTHAIEEQRAFYRTMPADTMFPGPVRPTILYRPEDALPRDPVVTDVRYLAPVESYGPRAPTIDPSADPYGLNRTENVWPALPTGGPVSPSAIVSAPSTPQAPTPVPLPAPVIVTTEPRPGSVTPPAIPYPGWISEGDGPPRPIMTGQQSAWPWWIALGALALLA